MNSIMDDIRGDDKCDTWNQCGQHLMSGGNTQPAAGNKGGDPAHKQLDKGNEKGNKELQQSIAKQIPRILFGKNLPLVNIGKYPAQQPVRKDKRLSLIHI